MSTPAPTLRVHLQAHRERAHLTRAELAALSGLSRQAIHNIESGAAVPSTPAALHLARALGVPVEALFSLPDPMLTARWLGDHPPDEAARVQLARVGGDWLAFPLLGAAGLHSAADGVLAQAGTHGLDGLVPVRPLADPQGLARTAVVAGCDPSLGVLATHAARQPAGRVLWRDQPSLLALRALLRGEAHAAGIHLWDPRSGESNRPFVLRELIGRPTHLYTLWDWEQGLMVAPGNPKRLYTPADLARPGVTLANRDPAAGSRLLLDAWLDEAGLSLERRAALPGYATAHPSHLALAQSVARGEADAGPGPRAAARACGLDFVPLQCERFDLVVPDEHLDHPGIQALLAAARQPSFHAELAALGGYDPRHAGELWRTTA